MDTMAKKNPNLKPKGVLRRAIRKQHIHRDVAHPLQRGLSTTMRRSHRNGTYPGQRSISTDKATYSPQSGIPTALEKLEDHNCATQPSNSCQPKAKD